MKKTKSEKKYYPEYVYIDKKEKMFSILSTQDRFAVMAHCSTLSSVDSRPNYKDIVDNCYSIMKYGGGFNNKEIMDIKDRYPNGVIQPLVSDAQGDDSGWGVLHLNEVNLAHKMLKKYNILEEFLVLPKEKQLSRLKKFLGPIDVIEHKPRVLVTDIDAHEGLIKGRQSWMDLNNIPFGGKTTGPVKGLIVPMSDMEEKLYKDYDLVVPVGENKINLSAEKLSSTIMLNRENIPENRYSRNLITSSGKRGRMPRNAFDLQSHLGLTPNVDLSVEKAFYETGKYTPEFIETLFGYTDKKTGEMMLRKEGKDIMAGAHPLCKELIEPTLESLLNLVKTKLEGRIPGVYGTAMALEIVPADVHRKMGYITRFPIISPVLTEYAIYKYCICIPKEIIKLFRGDLDGDQFTVYHRLSMHGLPTWKHDAQWLTGIMAAPDKVDAVDNDKSVEEVMGSQIDQSRKCGQIYNICKILEECAKMEGWSRRDIFSLSSKLNAQIVQPYIDGFKYAAEEGKLPTVKKLGKMYGVPLRWEYRAKRFFDCFRTNKASIPRMTYTANYLTALSTSPMYYERLAHIFKDWRLCEEGKKHVVVINGNVIINPIEGR